MSLQRPGQPTPQNLASISFCLGYLIERAPNLLEIDVASYVSIMVLYLIRQDSLLHFVYTTEYRKLSTEETLLFSSKISMPHRFFRTEPSSI
jgi:hypothetical protein